MTQIVVVGAGIIGLYTVFELIERGIDPHTITIIAEFFPGDQSIHYASPYAGAYYTPFVDTVDFARYTYERFNEIVAFIGHDRPGITKTPTVEHFAEQIREEEVVDIVRFIPDLKLGRSDILGCKSQASFTGITFNPPLLTASLFERFKTLGVKARRHKLKRLEDVIENSVTAVFNCSGLGAALLADDDKVYPTRGQAVVIRDSTIDKAVAAWTTSSSTYVIPRPFSGTHEVILGGFYQPNVSTPDTFGEDTEDIIDRTSKIYPHLLHKKSRADLEIMRVVVGLRPSREGGARVEQDLTKNVPIYHNYGAGGSGFINGLGMANKCVELYLNNKDT